MGALDLGGGIRRLRIRKGWTQFQLAEFSNVAEKTVGRHERGETGGDDTRSKLCNALGAQPEEVTYEAGLARILTDAISGCERQGVPIIERVLGKEQKDTDHDDPERIGLPKRVVDCAEALEERIEAGIQDDKALAQAITPLLRQFIAQDPEKKVGLSHAEAQALVQLVGALATGFIKPLSIDFSDALLRVKDIQSGWLMQLVFNTHRAEPVVFQVDWESRPPKLLPPECSFSIPKPDSALDRRFTDRKTLVRANGVAPAFPVTTDWLSESQESLDRLPFSDAFWQTNQALLSREDDRDRPFAYTEPGRSYGRYVSSLHTQNRLPSLKVLLPGGRGATLVLKASVQELHVQSFVVNAMQAIKEARLTEDVDQWLEGEDVDALIETLQMRIRERTDLEQSDEALSGLDTVQNASDRQAALREWLVKWGGRLDKVGSQLETITRVQDWIMKILNMGGW